MKRADYSKLDNCTALVWTLLHIFVIGFIIKFNLFYDEISRNKNTS